MILLKTKSQPSITFDTGKDLLHGKRVWTNIFSEALLGIVIIIFITIEWEFWLENHRLTKISEVELYKILCIEGSFVSCVHV